MNYFLKALLLSYLFVFSLCAEVEKVIIIGSGSAGLTAALFAGQAHLNPLVIEGDKDIEQFASIYKIENFPGFPEGISGRELSEKMYSQAMLFGARFEAGIVEKVDLSARPFRIFLSEGRELLSESLIVATGAGPRLLGLANERSFLNKGISTNATMDAPKFLDKEVVVVGGGDSAMDQALLLTEYASKVTIIYKEKGFYGAQYLQERVFSHPKIAVIFQNEIAEIQGTDYLSSVILKNGTTIPCQGLFVSNGRQPNTQFLEGQIELTKGGYVVTKADSTETQVPGVFIAGDIGYKAPRKLVTSAASGASAAVEAAKFLKENKL